MDISPPSSPYRVGFLLIDGFALMSYAAATEPLRAANLLSGRTLYQVRAIPAKGVRAVSSGGAFVEGTARVGGGLEHDLVLVVAGGDPSRFYEQPVTAWLRRLARYGVRLGGISGGPVILARAGLLAGRRYTVHWEHADALASQPDNGILEASLFVMDRDRVTCAGGLAAADMMHALIADQHGAGFARQVSDWFVHTDVRGGNSPQPASPPDPVAAANPHLLAMRDAMRQHIADPLSLDDLARRAGISARQLNRLCRDRYGQPAMQVYRALRIEKTCELLSASPLSITEIALAGGFANSSHFASVFKAETGKSPRQWRKSALGKT